MAYEHRDDPKFAAYFQFDGGKWRVKDGVLTEAEREALPRVVEGKDLLKAQQEAADEGMLNEEVLQYVADKCQDLEIEV